MKVTVASAALKNWVDCCCRLIQPDEVVWIDGSEEQKQRLTQEALGTGELIALNQELWPGCVLHRTAINDVARVEHLTFICAKKQKDTGPTNNWMEPEKAYHHLGKIFEGSFRGRTMYVIPYLMGPFGSKYSRIGVEITDSIYAVLNMRIMTRVGNRVLETLGEGDNFVRGLHGQADKDPERRFICHFPEDNTIWSVGSGYGGNVLLSKKCHALRLASWQGRQEGWMAEHMLILGVESPEGQTTYLAAAFPSACGKTNLAMLIPPENLRKQGWKVWTVGDDIAWMHVDEEGALRAVNPEHGFFGVAPGTSLETNPNAILTVKRNSIFTNVVLTPEHGVWWEGMGGEPPPYGVDWMGNPWAPTGAEKGAHPNARFTTPAAQCPCISPHWEDPAGVPISAIIFGGRRSKTAPLVYQAFDWEHGVYVGATMASGTTAAATGALNVVRRDPMAMLPFCGYSIGDYFRHWLAMGQRLKKCPQVFHVNWFRTDDRGNFLWPGFGENMRVLLWILERCQGRGAAVESPIGYLPTPEALNTEGLDLPPETLRQLLTVDREVWENELESQSQTIFEKLGEHIPEEIRRQKEAQGRRIAGK